MTIKIFKICLFDGKRVHELYELNEKAAARLREMETERDFHRVQLKGYGKDFEAMLREQKQLREEIEVLKRTCEVQHAERDEWEHRYRESEKARKSLGEKLCQAEREMDRLREEKGTSSTASGSPSPCAGKACAGESETEGGDEA